jgi:hypothetical protein
VIVANVVDVENIGMAERGGGAEILSEALQAVGIAGERCGKDLDGDVAVQASIAGAETSPMPPAQLHFSLWKLGWFVRDFLYDPELLSHARSR